MPYRKLVFVLLAVLLLVTVGCGGSGGGVDIGGGEGGEGGTLDAAISGEPDRFDPHLTSAYASFQVLENVYDTLVQPGDDLIMEPALATAWEVSEDNLTWTFQLREGVKWHNGRDFVADDVVFSFKRIMDEEIGAANAYRFENVESVTAPDDATVEITVAEPTPNLLELVGAFKGMSIVPREIVEDGSIDSQPVGTGPFRFVEYVPNDRIVLERNPDYWQDGKPYVDEVVYRPIPDQTVMLTNLRTGEVDWIDSIPPQQVDQLSASDDIVVESTPSSDYWYLAMNLERDPFNERDVRRAVATAIDRAAVTEAAKFEAATPNQAAIPETSFWYHEYAPYEPDVEEARRLLEGAGAGDGFPMEIMVTDEYPETVTAAQVIESQLEPLGIDVNIRTLDFATWLDEQGKGNFDAFLLGWLGNIDPHDYYYAQHHTGEGFNFHGYSNPEVDELLEQGAVQTDRDERKKIYDEAAELIVDDASYVYLYNPDTVNAWRPQLSGFNVRGDAAIRFEDVRLQD